MSTKGDVMGESESVVAVGENGTSWSGGAIFPAINNPLPLLEVLPVPTPSNEDVAFPPPPVLLALLLLPTLAEL